jgi:L-alanine-DL-glutamate epimerase-like enolase superfamily enzyme
MEATLYRHDVALAHAVLGGAQHHEIRSRLYLSLRDGASRGVGEVAPQPRSLNGDPGVDEVVAELVETVIPQLLAIRDREGALASWSRWGRLVGPRPASRTAVALVEMALLDIELRREGCALDKWWPAMHDPGVQRAVSLLDGEAEWPDLAGVRRLRAKVSPSGVHPAALDRVAAAGLPVILDFNATATDASQVHAVIARVASHLDVVAIEQPFRVGNLVDTAALAREIEPLMSLDEGVRSLVDVEQIARYEAARLLCVKPARVGGLANARAVIAKARERGMRVYVGGFFESPYARHVHRLLAQHCDVEASDVAPVATRGTPLALVKSDVGLGWELNEDVLEVSTTRLRCRASEP